MNVLRDGDGKCSSGRLRRALAAIREPSQVQCSDGQQVHWSAEARKTIHPWPGMLSPPPAPRPSLKKIAARLARARESMRAGRPGTQAALDRWRNIAGPPAEDPVAEGRVASLLGINGVYWNPGHPATVGSDLVDHWVAHRGLAYATRALCASHALEVTYEGRLVPNSQPDSVSMSGWKTLRACGGPEL